MMHDERNHFLPHPYSMPSSLIYRLGKMVKDRCIDVLTGLPERVKKLCQSQMWNRDRRLEPSLNAEGKGTCQVWAYIESQAIE